MLRHVRIGHVRVIRVDAAHDTRGEWRPELCTQLTEKLRGCNKHETIERPGLPPSFELGDQLACKAVLAAIFVRLGAVGLLPAVLARRRSQKTPGQRGVVRLKQAGMTAVADENPGVRHECN